MANRFSSNYFSILNKNGKEIIYRTNDASINVLAFKIINASTQLMELKGNGDTGDGSFFRFDFESMLPEETVKNMTIDLPDSWQKEYTPGENNLPGTWTLRPTTDLKIYPSEDVKFTISNFTCPSTQPGNFEIMAGNVPGYSDTRFPITRHLSVENPVDPSKKTLPLQFGYINPVHPIKGQLQDLVAANDDRTFGESPVDICITYNPQAQIENGFTYFLTNTSKDPLVPPVATNQIEADNPPVVYISFLFGEAEYDVTTQDLADNNIGINVKASVTQWVVMKHKPASAYWMIDPQSSIILDGHETVYFPISKIITPLNVTPNTISILYIQINNVPGYNDAVYTLPLVKKKAIASIPSLKVDPDRIKFGENVKIEWITSLAWRVTLKYNDRDGKTTELDSEKGEIRLNESSFSPTLAPTAENTKFTLSAYDDSASPVQSSFDIHVEQPPVVIESFTADPMLVDVSKPATTTFSWQISNAQKADLETPDGKVVLNPVNGKCQYDLQNTSLFTLTAFGYGSQFNHPVHETLRIYAYKPGPTLDIPFNGENAMQTFPAIVMNNPKARLYVSDPAKTKILCYDVTNNNQIAQYDGTVISLSQDGTKLFVFSPINTAFGISIIDVASNAAWQLPGFGPVYQMIATPDLTKLYCASTHNLNTVTWLKVNAGANTMEMGGSLTVGVSPRAMAFNSDSSKLYVANYDSHNVSVIDVATNTVIKTIDITITEPHYFAYHKEANKLYVACEGSDIIVVIDTASDAVITQIKVGNRPSTALISPKGDLVFVANYGANTVSVIETASDQVTSTLTVGQAPIAMALNSDGNVFFVGNYCSKSLSVVDINRRVVLPQALDTGSENGNPFGLAVYTEGNDYSRIYVAKENFELRTTCTDAKPNTSINVSVYSVQKPGRSLEFTKENAARIKP